MNFRSSVLTWNKPVKNLTANPESKATRHLSSLAAGPNTMVNGTKKRRVLPSNNQPTTSVKRGRMVNMKTIRGGLPKRENNSEMRKLESRCRVLKNQLTNYNPDLVTKVVKLRSKSASRASNIDRSSVVDEKTLYEWQMNEMLEKLRAEEQQWDQLDVENDELDEEFEVLTGDDQEALFDRLRDQYYKLTEEFDANAVIMNRLEHSVNMEQETSQDLSNEIQELTQKLACAQSLEMQQVEKYLPRIWTNCMLVQAPIILSLSNDGGEGLIQLDAYDSFVVQVADTIIDPLFINQTTGFEVANKRFKIYIQGPQASYERLIDYYALQKSGDSASNEKIIITQNAKHFNDADVAIIEEGTAMKKIKKKS